MARLTVKKLVTVGTSSFLGAVVGNLIYHLLRAYRQAQQVQAGSLPETEVVRAAWVPQSTLAATALASGHSERANSLAFLLGLGLTLIAVPALR